MTEKSIELIKKLKALADKGVGGEKVTAQQLLERELKKLGLTIEDIDSILEPLIEFEFKFESKEHKKFLIQIAHSIKNPCRTYKLYRNGKLLSKICLEFTSAEAVEFSAKAEFYWARYQEEKGLFYKAFIQKNRLFTKGPGSPRELTEEDYKVLQMADALDRHNFHKQLNAATHG